MAGLVGDRLDDNFQLADRRQSTRRKQHPDDLLVVDGVQVLIVVFDVYTRHLLFLGRRDPVKRFDGVDDVVAVFVAQSEDMEIVPEPRQGNKKVAVATNNQLARLAGTLEYDLGAEAWRQNELRRLGNFRLRRLIPSAACN